MQAILNGITIEIQQQSILNFSGDALVLTATPDLQLNASELGKAVLAEAGITVQQEASQIGFADYGEAVITSGGVLAVKHIIHAVGPQMGLGGERGKLGSAVRQSLLLAKEQACTSIGFTPLSTGQFGYPWESCAAVMAQKIVDFTFENSAPLKTISLCIDNPDMYSLFEATFRTEIEDAQD